MTRIEDEGQMLVELDEVPGCELASYGSFVVVRAHVRVSRAARRGKMVSVYRLGHFLGRETECSLSSRARAVLVFRVPAERFREGQHIELQLRHRDGEGSRPAWAVRCEMSWEGGDPRLRCLIHLESAGSLQLQ